MKIIYAAHYQDMIDYLNRSDVVSNFKHGDIWRVKADDLSRIMHYADDHDLRWVYNFEDVDVFVDFGGDKQARDDFMAAFPDAELMEE